MKTFFMEVSARMRRLFGCLLLCTSVAIAGCGGGDSAPSAPVVVAPAVDRTDILFGYFAVDGNQIAETADHVNVVLVPDWGPWDDPAIRNVIAERMIAQLQEADARGIHKFVVSIGVFVYSAEKRDGQLERFRYRGTLGMVELDVFKRKLDALGLSDKVVALYPVDEPELHDLSDAEVARANADIRKVWEGPKLAVIYGDTGRYPGKDSYDWVGLDNYGAGAGVLSMLPPIRPDQKHILVPGGAEPWKHDPQPFYDYANANPNVAWITPFVWFDGFEGSYKGVRSNGMAEQYRAIGRRVRGQ